MDRILVVAGVVGSKLEKIYKVGGMKASRHVAPISIMQFW